VLSEVSVIIPAFNEAENLHELHYQLTTALRGLSYELVFVDDGSTDGTFELLTRLHDQDSHVRIVRLARNYGQHAALVAGLDHAKGHILVSFDADLQFDPQDIPRLVAAVQEGYDVVSGCRDRREDGFWRRRLPSMMVAWAMRAATGRRLRDAASPFKAIRAELARTVQVSGEMRRFLGAVVLRSGRRVTEIAVAHRPRRAGRSKYSFLDLVAGFVDFITAFCPRAFQVVGLVGVACIGLGLVGSFLYLISRITLDMPALLRAQFQVAVLLVGAFGVQCLILGLLGELTTRIYRLVQDRPLYVVRDVLG
jgi:glycosyltransferase involved in cell wall biosynthesis